LMDAFPIISNQGFLFYPRPSFYLMFSLKGFVVGDKYLRPDQF